MTQKDDTDDSVYTVAFSGGRFLMVRNERRGGWEMPGGHVKRGETREQAAAREFSEESGMSVRIVASRDLGHCGVCAAVLEGGTGGNHEMPGRLFSELPAELGFPRDEYLDTVPWAYRQVYGRDIPPLR